MIEWKYEKKLIDYRFAEEEMSKRVESIISNHKTELIWCLEHYNIYTLNVFQNFWDCSGSIYS